MIDHILRQRLRRLVDELDTYLTDNDSLSRIRDEYGAGTAAAVRKARRALTIPSLAKAAGQLEELLTDGDSPKRLRDEGHGPDFVLAIRLARLAARKLARSNPVLYGVCGWVGMRRRWVTKTFPTATARAAWLADVREHEGIEIDRTWED